MKTKERHTDNRYIEIICVFCVCRGLQKINKGIGLVWDQILTTFSGIGEYRHDIPYSIGIGTTLLMRSHPQIFLRTTAPKLRLFKGLKFKPF